MWNINSLKCPPKVPMSDARMLAKLALHINDWVCEEVIIKQKGDDAGSLDFVHSIRLKKNQRTENSFSMIS